MQTVLVGCCTFSHSRLTTPPPPFFFFCFILFYFATFYYTMVYSLHYRWTPHSGSIGIQSSSLARRTNSSPSTCRHFGFTSRHGSRSAGSAAAAAATARTNTNNYSNSNSTREWYSKYSSNNCSGCCSCGSYSLLYTTRSFTSKCRHTFYGSGRYSHGTSGMEGESTATRTLD